jgi:hypothetical protein
MEAVMPRDPKARKRQDIPPFLVAARGFYGEAFEARRKSDLAESMADWADLTEDERSFALAHLQYLNLVAQAGTQRLLGAVLEVLEEIEDDVGEALEGRGEPDDVDDEEPERFDLESLPVVLDPEPLDAEDAAIEVDETSEVRVDDDGVEE